MCRIHTLRSIALSTFAAALFATAASANPLSLLAPDRQTPDQRVVQPMFEPQQPGTEQAARFKRQVVDYATHEVPGTLITDTPNTYLYLVLGNGRALRYGIGVGREGFTWSGVQTVTRKTEWPDWTPPPEMLERQPYLPRFMAGRPRRTAASAGPPRRASWPAAPAIRSAPAPCISAAPSTASTAPTSRRPS